MQEETTTSEPTTEPEPTTDPETTTDPEPTPEPDPAVDYTDQLESIKLLLEQQNDLLLVISDGTNMIFVYGFIVAPLLILCTMFWWFFKQFLYKF